MYACLCFFCGQTHSSEFWDVLEASIERCREKASAKDRGELDSWEDGTIPIRCEAGVPPESQVLDQERAA